MNNEEIITVTSPLLPDLSDFESYLEDIWNRKWITNNGYYHQELEKSLSEFLGVKYISLFTNGTLPLITGFQALGITEGEVITTPYSFVATSHSIWWNGLTPVFVDVDPVTGNIDPSLIEKAITSKTVAIMPVHVYGNPCDIVAIKEIANKYNLKVIYDAAHAFAVTKNEKSILEAGDISTLSFHATKVYNTIEGGALICHSLEMKRKIDQLKNFGFTGELTVEAPEINSKMDEIRSAYGLLNLKQVNQAIESRKNTAHKYSEALKDINGIRILNEIPGVKHNYSYYPIFVDEKKFGMSRDQLYEKMKNKNIYGRRYFYPLITDFEPYKYYPSASKKNLPNAYKIASEVICLPMYAFMDENAINRVIECIKDVD